MNSNIFHIIAACFGYACVSTSLKVNKLNMYFEVITNSWTCHRVWKMCSQTGAWTQDLSPTGWVLYRLSYPLPDTLSPMWWLSLYCDKLFKLIWLLIKKYKNFRYMSYSLNESLVRSQDAFRVLTSVSGTYTGQILAWRFFQQNWKIYQER